jgi:DNA-binding GntR family transcriptional regulator
MEKAPKRRSLTEFAVEQIRKGIRDGDLAPNSFTTAEKLASEMGMSRTPVREALLRLEQAGMVRIERNQGVTILSVTTQDLEDAFQLRFMLEVPAAYRAAEQAGTLGESTWENLQKELDKMNAAAKKGDYTGFMDCDEHFHELIHVATGNRRLPRVVREIRQAITDRGVLTEKRLFDDRGVLTEKRLLDLGTLVGEHVAVRDAMLNRDPATAAAAMSDHLRNTYVRILDVKWPDQPDQPWFNPSFGLSQRTIAGD